ncbi:MAG: retroviral-like aspartic protease family protein [Candidatus Obscuribacter phosphatis]|uniref:Retroviral-like aspartic protease family protein n=1 Tax=Candidatus Obscuribacter phosphatis TaxID=1906157 RepID=A0A8J7PAD7_9BACT|nr:retroviral-like aspartic protease family protein [Candidatus Obscuribacter phosphatis]
MNQILKSNILARTLKSSIIALTLGFGSAALGADDSYKLGLQAYNKNDFAEAARHFEAALQKTQNDPLLWYYDALCYHHLKNWSMAKSRYKTTANSFPLTEPGRRAAAALKAIDPSFVPPKTLAATTVSAQGERQPSNTQANNEKPADSKPTASADDAALDQELAGLPDSAHFYFKKSQQGHMEVDLMVNGHPVKAIFDTGASALFYKDQLKEAGLDLNRAKAGKGTRGWAGVEVSTEVMPAQIKLGTLTRTINIKMPESSNSLSTNLIGQDFIKGYQYEIDDKGGRVDLKKKLAAKQEKLNPLYDIPIEIIAGKEFIVFTVNSQYAKAFIDTGASNTIFDAFSAARFGAVPTGEVVHMSGVGGDLTMKRAYVNIRIGGMYRDNFPILIGGSGACALGQDLMEGWKYKVDRENKLLRFFH